MAPNTRAMTDGAQRGAGAGTGGGGGEGLLLAAAKRAASRSSWANDWTVRTALSVSSATADGIGRSGPASARDRRRTRRPKTTIGSTTSGTTSATTPARRGLVVTSMATPPITSSRLRSAWLMLAPMTAWMTLVSVVSRDSTSPVRIDLEEARARGGASWRRRRGAGRRRPARPAR